MADAAAYDKRHKSNPLKLRKGTRVQYHTHIKKIKNFLGKLKTRRAKSHGITLWLKWGRNPPPHFTFQIVSSCACYR